MENETAEQSNSRPWLYKKGQSGNPSGRPKGSITLKTYLSRRFQSMTDAEREEFLDGIDKKVLWEMAEGKPDNKTELSNPDGTLKTVIVNKYSSNNHASDDKSDTETN